MERVKIMILVKRLLNIMNYLNNLVFCILIEFSSVLSVIYLFF